MATGTGRGVATRAAIELEAKAEMTSWVRRLGFNPDDLRAFDRSGRCLWHAAATGGIERCEHLKASGLGDMISHNGYDGRSPLSKYASRREPPEAVVSRRAEHGHV